MIHRMVDGSQELDTLSILIHSDQWEENSVNIWKQRKFPEKISRNVNKSIYFSLNGLTLTLRYFWMQDYLMISSLMLYLITDNCTPSQTTFDMPKISHFH
jgi:hypothetical protein